MTVEFISQSPRKYGTRRGSYLRPLDRQSDSHTGMHSTVIKMSGSILGRIAQSLKCLAADMCLTAGPGVVSSILAPSHTFREIDHGKLISKAILSLPLI